MCIIGKEEEEEEETTTTSGVRSLLQEDMPHSQACHIFSVDNDIKVNETCLLRHGV